jgi:hypothetical protein
MIESDKYPVDELGFPERGDTEDFIHYHRRWLQLYATENAEKRRKITTDDRSHRFSVSKSRTRHTIK